MYIDDGKSAISSDLFQNLFEKDYKTAEAYHRINQDFNGELETRDSYKGREILEMLQNAEDQKSSYFFISVNTSTKTICFYNGGVPFSKKGFDAILYAKTSPKQGNLASIGNKGLGFRSILNWAEAVDIYSRHTHVSFSVEIAKKKWEELRKFFSDKGFIDNIKEIQSNANRLRENKHEINVPLSVFAVPEASTYSELPSEFSECNEDVTTVIKVNYKSDLQEGIIDQLKAIHNETLLFIKNIKKITIKIDNVITTIHKDLSKREPWNKGFVHKYTITNGEKTSRYSVYTEDGIYKEYEKEIEEYTEEDNYLNPKLTKKKITERYQIGIAIVESSNSKTNDSENKPKSFPLYSFFETQVKTNLPCILHGSFNLSPDRKQLQDENEYNVFLQKELGQKFIHFVEFFAKKRQEDGVVDWFPLDQIKTLNNNNIPSELDLFKQEMDNALLEASIYPSIANGYCKLNDSIAYTENFARLIQEKPIYVEAGLGKHLLSGFSKRNIDRISDDNFVYIINHLSELINNKYERNSQNEDCYTERVILLNCLYEIGCKSGLFKVLTDDDHNLLLGNEKEKLYINTGIQLVQPPSFLHFQYIDKSLVKALKEKWETYLLFYDNEERGVADILQKHIGLLHVSAADISRIKEKIVNVLHNKPTKEEFKALIKCLYLSYQSNPELKFLDKKTNNGLPYYRDEDNTYRDNSGEKIKELLLMGADEKFHPSMSIVIYDKQFPHGLESEYAGEIRNEWKLWGSANDWKNILNETDLQKIENFFVNVFGVALYVPLVLHGFRGDELVDNLNFWLYAFSTKSVGSDHYRSWYVTDSYKNKDLYNLSFCPHQKFLQEISSTDSWKQWFIIFLKSEYIYRSLLQTSISYRYQKSLGIDLLNTSFTAYSISELYLFNPIKDLLIETERSTIISLNDRTGRNISDIENILVQLGAHRTLNDLDIPSLYKFLNTVTERFENGENISIQSEYKKIRKYILDKSGNNDRIIQDHSAKISKLVAKKGKTLAIFPKDQVYYWDVDKFPQAILGSFPKLEIGTKVGEESVEKIFGVKRLTGLEIEISDKSEINEMCEKNVKEALQKRFPYILATRCADDGIKRIAEYANILKKIDVKIYSKCFYRTNKEMDYQDATDGDLLRLGSTFVLCSRHNSYDEALKNPHFSESLVEIFCLSLSASEGKWFDSFRAIFKNTIEENQYFYDKDFADSYYKESVSKSFGISEKERIFWKTVSEKIGCSPFNEERLAICGKEKAEYIDSVVNRPNKLAIIFDKGLSDIYSMSPSDQYQLLLALGIDDASILGETSSIQKYYEDLVMNIILPNYIDYFAAYLRNKINDTKDKNNTNEIFRNKVITYLDEVENFKNHDAFDALIEEIKDKILTKTQIEDALRKKIDANFDFNSLTLDKFKNEPVKRINTYDKIMQKYGRSASDVKNAVLSYSYFEGFEDLFEEALIQENTKTELVGSDSDNSDSPKDPPTGKIYEPDEWTNDTKPSSGEKKKKKGKRHPFATSGSKITIGKTAEEITLEWLEQQENLEVVRGLSSNLNSLIVNSNDSAHRDIAYREKGAKETRHLEVKSVESGIIYFSKEEYDFGSNDKNKNLYDIALVKGNHVDILKSPYTIPTFKPEPDTYKVHINFKIKENKT